MAMAFPSEYGKEGGLSGLADQPVLLGDPFILLHKGTYYAYGTAAKDGIEVFTSDDLLTWRRPANRLALKKGDVWGTRWFWAPEVYAVNGKFYMYYTADEHICVAVSDSPLGPFKQEVKKPILADEKCIDNSLFIDDDGKPYLLFDRFNDGLNVWIAELEDDLMTIKAGTMRSCIHVSQKWEEVWPRVNEGPFIRKHKGVYYMTYSGNSYESQAYGIGYATATTPMGPWTKYTGNPILQKPGDLVGVGHSATFTDKEGNLRIVFHSHQNKSTIHPRRMHISTVTFQKKGDKDVMVIDDNYMSPTLEQEQPQSRRYTNPVFEPILADPSVIRDPKSGQFYAYGTEDNWGDGHGRRLVPILRSADLVNWTYVGDAFTAKPSWKTSGGLWAPDVNYVNGHYYLYYSYSTWGDANPGIGLAIATGPAGPFIDQGKLFDSKEADVPNSIDPLYYEENGKKYLFWGSFSDTATQGVHGVELSADGRWVPDLTKKFKIAAGDFEAVMIHKRGNYYYFLGSKGSCCEGANSKYNVRIARSTNLKGPYRDKEGNDIAQRGNGTLFLQGNDVFVGPGHNARILKDDTGMDWLIYHGIDKKQGRVSTGSNRRVLLLDRVTWKDGWPEITGQVPSTTEQAAPLFQ